MDRPPTAAIKPDLVAPGTHISGLGWRPTGSPFDGSRLCGTDPDTMGVFFPGTPYSASSGTSHAAPAVSGLAAAARWAYRRAIGPYPSAAMVKAMLLGGTTPVSGNGAGVAPGVDQGFGLARLQGAATAGRWFDDEPVVFTQSGQSFTRTFDVTDDAQPVRVTLAWTDAPGPLTGAAYVNDLDLEVSGAGALYRGNHIVDGVSAPGGAPDPRNNVESVIVPAGQLDSLAVRVRATNVAGDGVPGGGTSRPGLRARRLQRRLADREGRAHDDAAERQRRGRRRRDRAAGALLGQRGGVQHRRPPRGRGRGRAHHVVAGHHDQRLADLVRHARPRPELVARDIRRDPRQQRLHGHPGRHRCC